MYPLQTGINVIDQYPLRINGLVIDVLGKPTDWRAVVQSVGVEDGFDVLASHVFNLGENCEKRIVCPVPNHKTKITSSKRLKVLTAKEGQAALYRGSYADGAVINRGEVYALASADCPTVSVHDPERTTTVVIHFSRQTGVVGNILEQALTHFPTATRRRLVATISLGIHVEHFDHSWNEPTYGEANKKLTMELIRKFGKKSVSEDWAQGGINLKYIAIEKLLQAGLVAENIHSDTIDTYSDPNFWSQRASTRRTEKMGETGRNLVLVANLS